MTTAVKLSAWELGWRSLVQEIPPVPCVCSRCQAGEVTHQEVGPEWEPVFDAFANLSKTNKVVAAGGEGSGKSHQAGLFGAIRSRYDLLTVPVSSNRTSQDGKPIRLMYWVIGADYEDAYKDWEYWKDVEESLDNIEGKPKTAKNGRDRCWFVTKSGVEVSTLSAKDPTKIAREEPDGIIGAEASRWSKQAFTRSYSRLGRKPHTWALMTGSFETAMSGKSTDPFMAEFLLGEAANENRLRSFSIPSWANRHIYPQGARDPRIRELKMSMSDNRFKERHEGRPAPPVGIVVPNFRADTHIRRLTVNESEPVYLFIDPGTLVYSILFTQMYNDTIWVLGEMYEHADSHEAVIDRAMMHPLWKFVTGEGCVMDFAGRAHHMGNPSAVDLWLKKTGISFSTSLGVVAVEDKAERVISLCNMNTRTGHPFVMVDPSCTGLITELGGGGENPMAELGGGMWMRQVGEDGSVGEIKRKNDHSSSALAYGAIHHFGNAKPAARQSVRGPIVYGAPPKRPDYHDYYPRPGVKGQTTRLNRRAVARVY